MLDVLRFWLDRGVDGFRVDVIWQLIKDDEFRDNPPNPITRRAGRRIDRVLPLYTADRPEVHDVVAEMRRVLDEFDDRMLIGEIYLPIERLVAYYGATSPARTCRSTSSCCRRPGTRARSRQLDRRLRGRAAAAAAGRTGCSAITTSLRIASRVGAAQARVAAMLLLTLRGTPTLYYGDEIGMQHVAIPPELVQDPFEKNVPGIGLGRDPARTPMQWDASTNAGFSNGEPWLPLADDHEVVNVAKQERRSAVHAAASTARLLALRREHAALSHLATMSSSLYEWRSGGPTCARDAAPSPS